MTNIVRIDQDILPVAIEEEMKSSYLAYAMSVIVSRAIPDVRDGLKPVHRRILYTMKDSGNDYNRPHRKSARIVGEVIGKYHPHGDAAIYEALVRMAQNFSMRECLVDGQGNFGSIDGDPPAAMRYTEVRLTHLSHFLLEDMDKATVDFGPNYDDTETQPLVLPARFPNILVNGAGGIAVGMATNIPTHNLGEVIDACCALIEDPTLEIDQLMQYVHGPDFPTGGTILGRHGIWSAFHTGRGSVLMRSKTHIEEVRKDRTAIIVTEIPYQVNKARLVERIAEVVNDKIVEGISDLRDESDRDGIRVVIELKRDATPEVVLNQLYRHTPLQTSFGVNMLALNNGRPELMNLKQVLSSFIVFREEVITRRTRFELNKARDRAHVLIGLAVAVANIDEIIAMIRTAPDPQTARERLLSKEWPAENVAPLLALIENRDLLGEVKTYKLTEMQAKAILDLRLHRLTALERDKIADELKEIAAEIEECLAILASKEKRFAIMRHELLEVKERFATPRKTVIEDSAFSEDLEALIEREDMVVTVSMGGYIKRVPLSTYRAQKRGGKGRSGMATRDEDAVKDVFVANTHTPLLFFSSTGKAFQLKVYKLPLGNPQARGKAMINILPLAQGETISTVMALPEDEDKWQDYHIMFATSKGGVRRNALSDFLNIRANGKIAMKLEEEDETLIAVAHCSDQDDVLLTTQNGKCIRFNVSDVRQFASRTSTGVRGIKLMQKDVVVSMSILKGIEFSLDERDRYLRQASKLRKGLDEAEDVGQFEALSEERFAQLAEAEEFLLSVTERGFGKRTSAYEYRITNRGGQGIANIDVTEKNGQVVTSFPVKDADQVVIVTDGGQLIRCPVKDVRIAGRKTQGVTLFKVAAGEKVVSVASLGEQEDDEQMEDGDEVQAPSDDNPSGE